MIALPLAAFALAAAAPPAPAAAPFTVAQARASLAGKWRGKLEYRDYQADRWFGLPVDVEIRDGGDGATMIRVADFDDGPQAGIVRITTVSMLGPDGASETGASFRKGRKVELSTTALALGPDAAPGRWTLVETAAGSDDDRPATLRTTTVRDGDSLVSTKEVDFTDDAGERWLVRNRTVLRRLP